MKVRLASLRRFPRGQPVAAGRASTLPSSSPEPDRMAKPQNPVDLLAGPVAATTYRDLPPAAVQVAKTFLLDSLGVAVAGSADPWARSF